ncbi:hypothetical protein V5S96_11305 [Corynebacterium mastitidis]|uniref:Uncharacterized protein n=1 Tax=Corynebacterium mastitidis TaxID=161890 RepID=A0ABU8P0X7_9CORY|nr:hypothetical protein [Corynebacterium mastitidis]
MTAPNQGIPEGGYSASGLAALQGMNEEAIKRRLRAPADNLFNQVKGNFVGKFADGIADVLAGARSILGFERLERVGREFRDGQTELNHRTDLLSPLLDYGSACMGNLSGWDVTGVMPFRTQIGPMRGCRLEDSGIRLGDKGLWDIRAQLTAESAIIVTGRMEWRVVVKTPQGGVYSSQRATVTSNSRLTQTLVSSVVVPEPGYLVQVELLSLGIGRTIFGGPDWNRLVVQHISREVSGSTGAEASQVPPDPVQGPPRPPEQ